MNPEETLKLYVELMTIVRVRLELFVDIIQNQRGLPPWAIAEFSQLQARLICEAFALACLAAHGDVKGANSARLTKAYQADLIIQALEKLHPAFYPIPVQQKPGSTKELIIQADRENGYLTKHELLRSYRRAANFLHIGSLTDILAKKEKAFDLSFSLIWARRVATLMSHHNIPLAEPQGDKRKASRVVRGTNGKVLPSRMIVFTMVGQDNRSQASIFERQDDFFPAPKNP